MGADDLSADESRQVVCALLRRSEAVNRRLDGPHLRVQGEQQPVVAAGIAERFHRQHRREHVEAASPVLLRQRQAEYPELGAALPPLARKGPRAIVGDDVATERTDREFDGRSFEGELVLAPREVHWSPPKIVSRRPDRPYHPLVNAAAKLAPRARVTIVDLIKADATVIAFRCESEPAGLLADRVVRWHSAHRSDDCATPRASRTRPRPSSAASTGCRRAFVARRG